MRSYGETYCAIAEKELPRCVVNDCNRPVVAEVHIDDYGRALLAFRGIRRLRLHARRSGDERFFACRWHLDNDARMQEFYWQELMLFE
jgi:hypothetical protein